MEAEIKACELTQPDKRYQYSIVPYQTHLQYQDPKILIYPVHKRISRNGCKTPILLGPNSPIIGHTPKTNFYFGCLQ